VRYGALYKNHILCEGVAGCGFVLTRTGLVQLIVGRAFLLLFHSFLFVIMVFILEFRGRAVAFVFTLARFWYITLLAN